PSSFRAFGLTRPLEETENDSKSLLKDSGQPSGPVPDPPPSRRNDGVGYVETPVFPQCGPRTVSPPARRAGRTRPDDGVDCRPHRGRVGSPARRGPAPGDEPEPPGRAHGDVGSRGTVPVSGSPSRTV